MLEEMIRLANEDPVATYILDAGLIATGIYFMRRASKAIRGMRIAKYVVEEGQYNTLSQDLIDNAVELARTDGKEKLFLALLTEVRRRHGHDGVKLGHLYWIWNLMDKVPDNIGSLDIPSFTKQA